MEVGERGMMLRSLKRRDGSECELGLKASLALSGRRSISRRDILLSGDLKNP